MTDLTKLKNHHLTPTEYLILETLTARVRLGENVWTYPSAVNKQLDSLEKKGLINWKSAPIENHSLAWFTPLGKATLLSKKYYGKNLKNFKEHQKNLKKQAKQAKQNYYASINLDDIKQNILNQLQDNQPHNTKTVLTETNTTYPETLTQKAYWDLVSTQKIIITKPNHISLPVINNS